MCGARALRVSLAPVDNRFVIKMQSVPSARCTIDRQSAVKAHAPVLTANTIGQPKCYLCALFLDTECYCSTRRLLSSSPPADERCSFHTYLLRRSIVVRFTFRVHRECREARLGRVQRVPRCDGGSWCIAHAITCAECRAHVNHCITIFIQ